MTMPALQGGSRGSGLVWDFMRASPAYRALSLLAFALIYSSLMILGLILRESSQHLTTLWPAAGLLFMTLWFSPRRNWIWILGVQVAAELMIDGVRSDHFEWRRFGPYILANSLDAVVGALMAGRLMSTPEIPRVRHVLQFLAAVAIGAAASAVFGAFGSARPLEAARYLREWQLWWAGNWLGSLCVAPVLMTWAVRWRIPEISAPRSAAPETAVIGVALVGMTIWVFSAAPGSVATILDLPFVLLALAILAAFRLPPRWCTTFAAAAALLASYYASRGLGPFADDPNPFVRVGAVQLYLATLVVITFMLSIVLLEMRNTVQVLRASGERYHNFVEQSSEAVWRIELSLPMSPGLPIAGQVAWLREHAYVAECNLTYLRLNRQFGADADARLWHADAPWSAIFLDNIESAARRGYSMDGLQFTTSTAARPLTYITGFRGVIEDGKLARVWGVARDVTELVELNARLRQKQERLQVYARQLVGAEERARRATAVDLHDGIGQQLVGLAMTLEAAALRSPPEVRLLLGEATHSVREVQAITQRVIADLSPPGLYELGLEPALKWLSVYMRGKDNLQVDLQVAPGAAAYDLELRVLIFKLIRELLRNVVKHSGVQSASVTVTETPQELRVMVEDRGVGFEWQLSLFEPRTEGFGLWSVADRVRAAAGEMTVDTAPGRGCRVSVVFPHKQVDALLQSKDSHAAGHGPGNTRSAAI